MVMVGHGILLLFVERVVDVESLFVPCNVDVFFAEKEGVRRSQSMSFQARRKRIVES